jgi:hypothetical protein
LDDLVSIRERIEGKRVVSVESNGAKLTLDDGTELWLYMSDSDCCAHAYGEWVIRPGSLEAIITDVKLDLLVDREYDGDGSTSHAKITILHNQNPVALADCYANDGNGGYYFSVLSLTVEVPGAEVIGVEVVSA